MIINCLRSALLILLIPCTGAWAQEDPVTAKPSVRFATSIIKPWGMEIEGQRVGLLVETTRALSRETGIVHDNIYRPYTRVFQELLSGYSDFALVFRSPNVDQEAIFVGPVTGTRVILVGLPDQPQLASLDDAQGLVIGHIRGSKYGPAFDQASHFQRQPLNSIKQGLTMLKRGRIDAMAAVDHTIYWGMREMAMASDELKELTSLPGPVVAVYMSKKSDKQALLPIYQQAVTKLHQQKAFANIFANPRKWLDTDIQP